jgi:hypothetical protein
MSTTQEQTPRQAWTEAEVNDAYDAARKEWSDSPARHPSIGVLLARRLGVLKEKQQ